MSDKHSKHELKRLVESAVADVCGLPRTGLWFCVDEVEATGRPPKRIKVWATLHFLVGGSPFLDDDPAWDFDLDADAEKWIGDHVRRAMGLRQAVSVEFLKRTDDAQVDKDFLRRNRLKRSNFRKFESRIRLNVHEGVCFLFRQSEPEPDYAK